MNRMYLAGASVALALALLNPGAPAQSSFDDQSGARVIEEHNVSMKTRDGVTLHADIYRPSAEGKYPVLLTRTPYDKKNEAAFGRKAAQAGFVLVAQDVRGRYTSEGEWYPFQYERNDGYDAVEWAAALKYSNGKVGMYGGSYVGATQMLAAIAHPPHLAGICPVVTASNYHENWTYQGGAFEQWFNESWTSGLAQDTLDRKIRQETNAMVSRTVLPLAQYPLFNGNVYANSGEMTKDLAPYFLDWLAHPDYDDYWKQWAIDEQYASIQVPALTTAAWYDIFQTGSLRNFVGMKAGAGTEDARRQQRLLVIIGGHAGGGRKIGSVDYGPAAMEYDGNAEILAWYSYLFLGVQNSYSHEKPVKIFVMGANQWRYEDSWPLKRAKDTRYFLTSGGNANSATGDGALDLAPANKSPDDSYVYDPANPVPTAGGPLCCDGQHLVAGPQDQRAVEARPDVLVYSTQPMEKDIEVTGPVILDLYASSSTMDTDFTAKLVDVAPDGGAINLTEGILRAKYRESTAEAKLGEPGRVYRYRIDLWSTSNVFLKGHRIRVEVSSSNFPRFDRNLNTGKAASSDAAMVKATNTIYHDVEHPSALVLPVVP